MGNEIADPLAAKPEADPAATSGSGEQHIGLIQAQLARTRQIWRTSAVISRALLWAGTILGALLVLAVLDNLLTLPGALRMLLSGAFVLGGVGVLIAWVLQPLMWKINDQVAAVYLERKLGERQNLLINAVQLSAGLKGAHGTSVSTSMIEQIVSGAAVRAGQLSLQSLWEKRRLRNFALAAAGAMALVVLYVVLLPAYAQNAFARYASPLSGVPALSKTRVLMFPTGDLDLLSGETLSVFGVACIEDGEAPQEATVIATLGGETQRIHMNRAEKPNPILLEEPNLTKSLNGFVYEFSNISKSFTFHLSSGDGESLPCRVNVRERPGVEEYHVELTPPAYTGLKATTEPAPDGMVYGLPGSRAVVSFKPTLALLSGKINLPTGAVELAAKKDGLWGAEMVLEKEGPYALTLKAGNGVEVNNAFEGQIVLRADGLPTAAFENQTLNIPARPGSTVPLALQAQDDFGLKSLRLIIRRQETGSMDSDSKDSKKEIEIPPLKGWQYPVPGPRTVNELYPLVLNPATYPPGATFLVYAEVADHCPTGIRIAKSAPLLIRVLTAEQMENAETGPVVSLFHQIEELIALETKARGKTLTIKEFLAEVVEKGMFEKRAVNIRDSQSEIQKASQKVLAGIPEKDKKGKAAEKVSTELQALIAGPMTQAIASLADVAAANKDRAKAESMLKTEEALQTQIISRLNALLGTMTTVDKDETKSAKLKDDPDAQRLKEKLEDAKEKIKEFIDAEKKIVKSTEDLEKKKPEDLTEEDKKTLGDLAKDEKDWAKYFKEKFSDLSKVPNQDFSNSKLAQEFNEVFQEIQKAADALDKKNTEIAVKAEQGGLELAKEIQTNLEKWLPDSRDSTKWSMEEPKGQFDVPLADLPKELEDIIGELIDEEDKMTDDVQDTSSSWMDSADKGAGWDASDGPISNMSAKGVTGNQLPNKQEVGGRSGEGRNGKSQGQFVEENADGKGGPQTPTRSTQDPYEEGQVKDKSKEALGGSTGGGKSAGTAGMGLRGEPPPMKMEKLERLKEQQTSIRQKAEKISTQLHAYHLPSSDSDEAVRKMQQIESKLQTGKGFDLRQAHSGVIDSLKDAKKAVGFQADINRERTRELPKHVRDKILSGMQTQAPAGYQDLMEAYYKSLVSPENKPGPDNK